MDVKRLFLTIGGTPLVIAVGNDQAATIFEGIPKRWFLSHRLASRVNHTISNIGILCPRWNESPTQQSESVAVGQSIVWWRRLSNCQYLLRRGNIKPKGQLKIGWQMKLFRQLFLRSPQSKSATHDFNPQKVISASDSSRGSRTGRHV